MAFYTGRGDEGWTTFFNRAQKISKSSPRIEALGALDELNSLLGLCKVKAESAKNVHRRVVNILEDTQNDLFAIQAELAGFEKGFKKDRMEKIEEMIQNTGKKLPEIKSFVIPGGSELSALLDCARAVARRAERRVAALKNEEKIKPEILAYLNRVSSLLFVLARLANKNHDITEKEPGY